MGMAWNGTVEGSSRPARSRSQRPAIAGGAELQYVYIGGAPAHSARGVSGARQSDGRIVFTASRILMVTAGIAPFGRTLHPEG
jgi:hypothetical protein